MTSPTSAATFKLLFLVVSIFIKDASLAEVCTVTDQNDSLGLSIPKTYFCEDTGCCEEGCCERIQQVEKTVDVSNFIWIIIALLGLSLMVSYYYKRFCSSCCGLKRTQSHATLIIIERGARPAIIPNQHTDDNSSTPPPSYEEIVKPQQPTQQTV